MAKKYLTHYVFLLLDLFGVIILILNALCFNNNNTAFTLGMTFITLGITLPISLYFQSKQSNETFEIINACNNAGIANVFEGRKVDESYKRLRNQIDTSFEKAKELFLCGIAFPELLDPGSASDSHAKRQLKNPDIKLKVVLLDPKSEAAQRRKLIEDPENICPDGKTICDINNTINNNLNIILIARLEKKYGKDWKTIISTKTTTNNQTSASILTDIKFEAKKTNYDPISFIIATDNCLFSEQYHFGRPNSLENSATCIGGYLPVLKFKKLSKGYDFLLSHFNYIWNDTIHTKDITKEHLDNIIKRIALSNNPTSA